MEHVHEYDDIAGDALICPVTGCWWNEGDLD